MTTPAREVATEKMLAYSRQTQEFQSAWTSEAGAFLAWSELAMERGPSDPDVVELRAAWECASAARLSAGNVLDQSARELAVSLHAVEREDGHG